MALAVTACSDSSSRKYFETTGLRTPASACTVDPRSLGQAQALPDIDEGNGCEVRDRYSVSSLAGVRFSQSATMNCGLAAPLNTLARRNGPEFGGGCFWRKGCGH